MSSYSRYSPGVEIEERIMHVPEEGELPNISEYVKRECGFRYLPLNKYGEEATEDTEKVSFGIKGHLDDSHYTSSMYLIWIEKRDEWIAVWHSEWSESNLSIDESESGPYALDDYCMDMLRTAFRIPSDKMNEIDKKLYQLSPSELCRLNPRYEEREGTQTSHTIHLETYEPDESTQAKPPIQGSDPEEAGKSKPHLLS